MNVVKSIHKHCAFCIIIDLLFRSELAEKEEGKEAEAEKRKQKLEEKAARKRELMLKSLME